MSSLTRRAWIGLAVIASVGFVFLVTVAAATGGGALEAAGPSIVRTETFTSPMTRVAAACVRPINIDGKSE